MKTEVLRKKWIAGDVVSEELKDSSGKQRIEIALIIVTESFVEYLALFCDFKRRTIVLSHLPNKPAVSEPIKNRGSFLYADRILHCILTCFMLARRLNYQTS
jgi:hypothetical protein